MNHLKTVTLLISFLLSSSAQTGQLASESARDEACQTHAVHSIDMGASRCENEFEIARDTCYFGSRPSAPVAFKNQYCELHTQVKKAKSHAGYGSVGAMAANQIIKNLADEKKSDQLEQMAQAVYNRESYHASACESAVTNCIAICGGLSEALVNKCTHMRKDAIRLAAAAEQASELGGIPHSSLIKLTSEESPKKKRNPARNGRAKKPKAPLEIKKTAPPVKKKSGSKDEMDVILDDLETQMGF